ncbi:MAG: M16 family metallopeptidase [Candidatus Velthaea sp.]
MVRFSRLPNGVRVLTEAMPHVRSATIGIWADVGSSAEPPERRGVSHLVEHMLFKGTTRRSARRIAEEMDGLGGNLNAFTDKESTCYYAHVMDRHAPNAVDVLSDMFLHSLFDAEELRKEQQVVLEEIKMYDDSPDEMIHDLFTRTMWRDSNLGEPTIGYARTVSAIDRNVLRGWMAARYAPQTVLVTAAGNLEHDEIVALTAAGFAGFTGRAESPAAERPRLTPAVSITTKDTEQAYVMLGMRGLPLRDDDRYALSVLDTIIGGGMSSRLFQEVREKRGLAYNVYSFQQGYRDAGLFGVYAGTSPDRVQECVDVIVDELDGALAGVEDDEVALAREHLKGNLTLALESTSSRMMRLGRNELVYGRQISTDELEARIDAVDRAAVERVAQTVLAPDGRGLCVLGPLEPGSIRFTETRAA